MSAERSAVQEHQSGSATDLVTLATPIFDVIMKVRAGIIAPSDDLRRTINTLLRRFEQAGDAARYRERQTQAAKFALAAFVDETVLTADFPLRSEWEKKPLQLEHFGEQLAGVSFFSRLDEALKNIERDVDVVEVYYVCLLIGFKGKYAIYMEDQLKGVIDTVADRLRSVGRLQPEALSPNWRVNDQPEPPETPPLPLWVKIGAGAGLSTVILLFMILAFVLARLGADVQEDLLR